MFGNIAIEFLFLVATTIGSITVFGLLIALCNSVFYNNFGSHLRAVCYFTGVIGTPLHEISHALMCLLFGHRVDKIVFFQPNSDDGVLGYVCHSHNHRNFYQNMGNFFIGVAPIIVMSALVYLLLWAFMPDLANTIVSEAGDMVFDGGVDGYFGPIGNMLAEVGPYLTSWQLWVFLAICLFICPHMTLSGADIKNSLHGLLFTLAVLLIITVCFGIFGGLEVLHVGVMKVTNVFNIIMMLALIVSLMNVLFSFIIRIIFGTRR